MMQAGFLIEGKIKQKSRGQLRQNIEKIASVSGHETIQKTKCRHHNNRSFL
jgi:hypothetical protein